MLPWPRPDPEGVEASEAPGPAGGGGPPALGPADVERRIGRIFAERLAIEVPSVETDLFATGAVDSLTFVELIVRLEEEFGVAIPLAELELEDLRSIRRIARFLSRGARQEAGR